MCKKDFSLLRPFDLEAAKAGAELLYSDLTTRKYVYGPDSAGATMFLAPYYIAALERFSAISRKDLEEQLAASQAREQVLREALENHSGNYKLSKDECKHIDSLLDASFDTTTLEAMIQKAGEVMRERCVGTAQDEMDEQYIDSDTWYAARACRDAIRTLPGVTMEDLK